MIYGIGTDIVRISRIQDNLDKYGERFVSRVLAEEEIPEFEQALKKANFLAKRFAAKEAIVKAMGTGFIDGLTLNQFVIGHDDKGKPTLSYVGRALKLKEELGIGCGFISLSDEENYAIAYVTLMIEQ